MERVSYARLDAVEYDGSRASAGVSGTMELADALRSLGRKKVEAVFRGTDVCL